MKVSIEDLIAESGRLNEKADRACEDMLAATALIKDPAVMAYIAAKNAFDGVNLDLLRNENMMLLESHRNLVDHIKKEFKRFNSHYEPYAAPVEEKAK